MTHTLAVFAEGKQPVQLDYATDAGAGEALRQIDIKTVANLGNVDFGGSFGGHFVAARGFGFGTVIAADGGGNGIAGVGQQFGSIDLAAECVTGLHFCAQNFAVYVDLYKLAGRSIAAGYAAGQGNLLLGFGNID